MSGSKRTWGWVASIALAACSSHGSGASVTLATLRDRAAQSSASITARRDRALAELVAPGGDLAVADRELHALATEAPRDVRVRFAEGLLAVQHGAFEQALAAWVAEIDAARGSSDPLAPALVEATVPRLIALRSNVREFDTPFAAVVDHAVEDPGTLGASARVELIETAVRWARERGLHEQVARWTEAAGCVTTWTVAGPWGPGPMLRFDEHLPPEGAGPMAASYNLGPSRGERATWTSRARGCAANIGHGVTLTGVFFAASDFTTQQASDAVVHVESPNLFAVLVDGVTVATVDPRVRAASSMSEARVHLAAGHHTLRVKIASRFHSPLLIATVTGLDGRPIASFSGATGGANAVPPEPLEAPLREPSPDADPFTRYALAERQFSRRDAVGARELLRPLVRGEHPTATALIAYGSVALSDPFLPATQSRTRAREAFDRARRDDPAAWYPSLALARLAADDERADDALAALREANTRFPNNPEIESELADKLMARNWEGEASAILEAARRRTPTACWPVRMMMSLAQRHGEGEGERRWAEELRRCDALSDAAASGLVRARRWGDAVNEYTRLLADDPEGRGLRRTLAEIARARGDHEDAARRATALLAEMPEDDSLRADLADLRVASGHPDEALALLDHELARSPTELSGLYRMRSVLSRREDLQPWRLDGRAVLRDFEASGHTYDSAAVLVLDYTVRRNYPDGSALELTHNVVKVQTQEGVDAYGEFSLPQGALLLRIRTLKADGRVLEPESVAGKESLSLPDLRPGDSLEFEYVRSLQPSDVAPGGFLGERFYFRGFDVPYDRSELVVVAPREMRVVVDPRGPAPETERTERGALVEYRWRVRQSERMTPEPRSVASREFIPSVAVGAEATWDHFVDALRERLMDQDTIDPEAERTVREVVGRASTASARLARLHRWVADNIQQEGNGTPFENAARMLAARQGHRTRVLCYMLKVAEVPCELVLVRPGSADQTRSELADDETYQSIMLRVRTEHGEQWVTAADHNAPVAYIPPGVAGCEGIALSAGAARVTLPPLDLNAHGRTLTVNLALNRDGSGRGTVEERLRGYAATGARAVLRRMESANRNRQFESYVGGMITGASVESVQIEGVEDPEAEMVFRYTFTAPSLADVEGGRLTFNGIFHADAAGAYADAPTRTVAMWNGDPIRATLDLTVTLPEGAQLTEVPAEAQGEARGVQWSIRSERTATGFHQLRRVDVPTGRVTVQDYRGFAEAVRALDVADTRRVVATLSGR